MLRVVDRSSAGGDQGTRAQEHPVQGRAQLSLLRRPNSGEAAFSPFAGMVQFPVCSNERGGSEPVEQIG